MLDRYCRRHNHYFKMSSRLLLLLVSMLALMQCALVATENIAPASRDCKVRRNADTRGKYCNSERCVTINYEEILKKYKNLFMTHRELDVFKKQKKELRDKYLEDQGIVTQKLDSLPGDGDSCCATSYVYHTNTTLENIDGMLQPIIHLTGLHPPQYQFIPHASCVEGGECSGKCVIEPITLTLLIYDFTIWSMAFDTFEIPGYCSCKNI